MRKNRNWALFLVIMTMITGCATRSYRSGESEPRSTARYEAVPAPEAEKLWREAEKAQQAGNIASSIGMYERIIHKYPQNVMAARAYHRLGTIYLGQGQIDKAMQFFDYVIYAYPTWDGIPSAKLDRLRAESKQGKQKQVMKEAGSLWESSHGNPEVQLGLSELMVEIYTGERDPLTGFDWASAGFNVAGTNESKKSLSRATGELLKSCDAACVDKLLKKNPNDFLKVFLYTRLVELEKQTGRSDAAAQSLRDLLKRSPGHPFAPEAQAALRGTSFAAVSAKALFDRVGCLVPLNGPYAQYGQMVVRGLNLAMDEWNEGHPNQKINLIVKDAQTDADASRKSLEELVRVDGVMAVIGPLGAQSAKALAPVADQWQVPLLALTQQDQQQTEQTFVIHVFINNRALVRTLVQYCRDRLGFTRFAALYPDDRYGQNLAQVFSEIVKESGGTLLASVSYKNKSTDFREPIEKLLNIAKKNSPPTGIDSTPFEVLFIPDQVQTVSLLAPQLPYHDVVGVTLVGTNLWGEAPLVQAGGVYVEHAIFATPFYAESDHPRVRSFREKFQLAYGTVPSYLEAQAYDALRLFLEARSRSDPRNPDRLTLLQNLLQIRNFEGVAGEYSFSPTGELDRNYMLFQVNNGQLRPLTSR